MDTLLALVPIFALDADGRPTSQIASYALNQRVRINTSNIEQVSQVANDSAELVKQGVELSAQAPEYYYSNWGDLKLTMLGEAAADARRRADLLASKGGGKVGALRYVHQGVFQITPAYSTAVSDYGMNDTTAKEKTIKATVTVRYSLLND